MVYTLSSVFVCSRHILNTIAKIIIHFISLERICTKMYKYKNQQGRENDVQNRIVVER